MDSDGKQDARSGSPVPHPTVPPEIPPERPSVPPRPSSPPPGLPPVPDKAPVAAPSVADWLNTERPVTRPGIWRFGHRPPKSGAGPRRLAPQTVAGLLIPLGVALLLWSLWLRGAVPYQAAVLGLLTPRDWWYAGTFSPTDWRGEQARYIYDSAFFTVVVVAMGWLGSWGRAARHFVSGWSRPARVWGTALLALIALCLVFPDAFVGLGWEAPVLRPLFALVLLVDGDLMSLPVFVYPLYLAVGLLVVWPFARLGGWLPYARERLAARRLTQPQEPGAETRPRAHWPELREAGEHEAAELLTAEVAAGRMNDVDCARVTHAFDLARRNASPATFRDTVLRRAGAAWTHPSGARDLPRRTARHDLLTGQVRIGSWTPGERVPLAFHGAGSALGPDVLGTSLLAVGPSGSGKTRSLTGPVSEALCLRALAGQAAVVVVGAAGAGLGPEDAYDVVVRIGDPGSVYDLDLYGGATDPDTAAAVLAEALAGDLDGRHYTGSGTGRAAMVLAQLLGPFHAVHGRFPGVPELRRLLDGAPGVLGALREALEESNQTSMLRELDVCERNLRNPGDVAGVLADRVALLDRPAFAGFFDTTGRTRPFSLRALDHHPVRVRVDLPRSSHADASRILTRLLLAQFTANAAVREERSLFTCLVLDDATGTVTSESLRRIQELRSRNAGVVLALRSITDVPEALHGPLFGAFGCRMAFSGVTTWDGSRFAQAWGTEQVEITEVAKHTVFAHQPMTRAIHAVRKLVTGKAVTTDAVTTRQVERERWSASDLAHTVPPGHAVLSLTDVKGEHAPPLLVDLRH